MLMSEVGKVDSRVKYRFLRTNIVTFVAANYGY